MDPMPERQSRRSFAVTATSAVSALWLGARWDQVAAALAEPGGQPSPPPTVLTRTEAADLAAMTALIFPTDATPGAREAQVARFIDRALGSFAADQRGLFREGLAQLRRKTFSALAERGQVAILEALDRARSPFFEAVRTATIMAMFSHPKHGGNDGKAGWRLIDFQDRGVWQAPFGDYDRPGSSK